MAKLPELCSIQYGYAFDSTCFTEDSTYLPLVRIRDVKRGYSETFYSGNYPNDYIIDNGSLLVGMDGEFNIARWKGGNALLNQRVCKITARKNVDEEYLRFALTKALKEIENRTSFVTVKHLSAKELNRLEIDIPDYRVQISISGTLTKIENIIFTRQQQLQKLDELVKARFVELFGDLANPDCQWDSTRLAEACTCSDDIKCGPFGTQLSKDEYTESGVAVWEIPQINNAFQSKPTHFLTPEKATQLGAYSIISGDIAMSRKGNVGKCALFPENFADGIIHSDVLRIRVDQKRVNPIFMLCQLHFSTAVTHQIELVSSGAIMAGVNVTKLKQIYVHIPPKDLQEQFAAFIEQVNKSKAVEGLYSSLCL